VHRKASLSALLLEEGVELVAQEFSTAVGPKAFDLCASLRLGSGCEGLVGSKRLVLGAKQLHARVVQIVVCESHVVLPASQSLGWRGSPDVSVYLFSKRGGLQG
jgi:hypothetical protein